METPAAVHQWTCAKCGEEVVLTRTFRRGERAADLIAALEAEAESLAEIHDKREHA